MKLSYCLISMPREVMCVLGPSILCGATGNSRHKRTSLSFGQRVAIVDGLGVPMNRKLFK